MLITTPGNPQPLPVDDASTERGRQIGPVLHGFLEDSNDWLSQSDRLLYRAKHLGRDRVVVAGG